MYHGSSRTKDATKLATEFDLVVTTYDTLGADYRRAQSQNPLRRIRWVSGGMCALSAYVYRVGNLGFLAKYKVIYL